MVCDEGPGQKLDDTLHARASQANAILHSRNFFMSMIIFFLTALGACCIL